MEYSKATTAETLMSEPLKFSLLIAYPAVHQSVYCRLSLYILSTTNPTYNSIFMQ